MDVLTRTLIPSHPLASGKCSLALRSMTPMRRTGRAVPMVYSYTQISQYLRCPRSYRYRYLDGWREKETRAAMAFGRCFENALGAYFREEDCSAALFKEWEAYRDAIGEIDGVRCLIDWKTTTSRYPECPEGLLSLDPQLICYSWISGISEVALVVFVRKHAPEIQYLRASISEEQRQEFGRLVEGTIGQIEAAQFVSHSGIRFPQNGCLSCPHLGLCLNNQPLIDTNLVRKAGASDLDWLDELVD